jgi:hypothetical protein
MFTFKHFCLILHLRFNFNLNNFGNTIIIDCYKKQIPMFLISDFLRVVNVVSFFWVIPRRLNFMYRRFGTFCSIFIGRMNNTYEAGTGRVFWNVGKKNSDAGESPKERIQQIRLCLSFIDIRYDACVSVLL